MTNFKTKSIGITNREVVNAFRNLIGDKVAISQENGWSFRLVYFFLLRYRARLIREKVINNRMLSQWNYQTIPCITVEKAEMNECPCAPASGCTWLKTSLPIPKPLHALKSVTSVDGRYTYGYVEWERVKRKLESRLKATREAAYYTIKTGPTGTYLYLYNDDLVKNITITGIFENPLEAQFFPGCDATSNKCQVPMDEEFILDPDILPIVYDMAIGQIAKAKQMGADTLNDDNDNISTTQAKVK